MKIKLTLADVKDLLNSQKCFETETCFLVNMYGKYDPNLCFVLDKYFHLTGNADPINPIEYIGDKEVSDNMNMDFNGTTSFMFGDYWVSKKGTKCFKIKPPVEAKHMLMRIDWGGAFNRTRGLNNDIVNSIPEILYYHKASSNGAGTGYDYLVVPVGFSKSLYDEEFDGEITSSEHKSEVTDYVNKFQKYMEGRFKKYDEKLKVLLPASIEELDECRNKYLTEIQLAQYHLIDIRMTRMMSDLPVTSIRINRLYFIISGTKLFYTEDGMKKFRDIYDRYH